MMVGRSSTPPTRDPGTSSIDHILVSQDLASSITASCFLPFHFITRSDHRALILELDLTETSWRVSISPYQPNESFAVDTKKNSTSYNLSASQSIERLQIEQRLQDITINKNHLSLNQRRKELEAIDRKLTASQLEAESHLPAPKIWDWSPALITANITHAIWKKIVDSKKTISASPESSVNLLMQLLQDNGKDPMQGDPSRSAASQLRIASKNLRKQRKRSSKLRGSHLAHLESEARIRVHAIKNAEDALRTYRQFRQVDSPQGGKSNH